MDGQTKTDSSSSKPLITASDIESWFSQHKHDKEWRWLPDCGSDGIAMPYHCSDCDTYHMLWWHVGFSKDEEGLHVELWVCDHWGDWDCYEDTTVGDEGVVDPSYNAILESEAQWHDYWAHVAETGEDPLEEILDRNIDFKAFAEKELSRMKDDHKGR